MVFYQISLKLFNLTISEPPIWIFGNCIKSLILQNWKRFGLTALYVLWRYEIISLLCRLCPPSILIDPVRTEFGKKCAVVLEKYSEKLLFQIFDQKKKKQTRPVIFQQVRKFLPFLFCPKTTSPYKHHCKTKSWNFETELKHNLLKYFRIFLSKTETFRYRLPQKSWIYLICILDMVVWQGRI